MPTMFSAARGGEFGDGLAAPYVTTWSEEQSLQCRLVINPDGSGVAYAEELPEDRDDQGVLWARRAEREGHGKPEFKMVHPSRQLRAMKELLCQVCAGPSDKTKEGVLWLLTANGDEETGWPESVGAVEPPICVRCVPVAVQRCPKVRRGHVLFRARKATVAGVVGTLYRPGMFGPVPAAGRLMGYGDSQIRWMVAAKLVRELQGCSFVDAEELCGAASLGYRQDA